MDLLMPTVLSGLTDAIPELVAVVGVYIAYLTYVRDKTQELPGEPEISPPIQDEAPLARLLVFDTPKQLTELVATRAGIQFNVTDRRTGRVGGVAWITPLETTKRILHGDELAIFSGLHPRFGKFIMGGNGPEWLYSKSLFRHSDDLEQAIRRLAKAATIEHDRGVEPDLDGLNSPQLRSE